MHILVIFISIFCSVTQFSLQASQASLTEIKQIKLDKQMLGAAGRNELERLQRSLQDGANINAWDPSGLYTALMHVAKRGHKDIILFLINSDANINIANDKAETFESILKKYHPELLKDLDIRRAVEEHGGMLAIPMTEDEEKTVSSLQENINEKDMAPSASAKKEKKSRPTIRNIKWRHNSSKSIRGISYEGHILDRMDEYGISPEDVHDIVKTGDYGKRTGTRVKILDRNKSIGIIYEPTGQIIVTVIQFNSEDEMNHWMKSPAHE